MILLCCDSCHNSFYPTKQWRWCSNKCKNIGGVFLYKGKHLITRYSKNTSRVIDVSNGVRYGYAKEGIVKVLKLPNKDIYETPYPENDEKGKKYLNRIILQNRHSLKFIDRYATKKSK